MAGVDHSFDRFVVACSRDLMNTAYLLCLDELDAEDLVQECLMCVAKRWWRVRDMDSPRAYARRVLVNLAIDGRGRRSRRSAELAQSRWRNLDLDGEEFEPADDRAQAALESVIARAPLMAALRRLTPHQRTVIILRYFHDLSEVETARALGCRTGTVKSSTARALARLHVLIDPSDGAGRASAAPMQPGKDEP